MGEEVTEGWRVT